MTDKKAQVVVTIYTDGDTHVDAPPDVDVAIQYETADGDAHCRCGHTIRRDEDGSWIHIEAPYYWGGDHDPKPRE
ncbi:hypothetical protein L3Q65_01055 (plasmid) [Amycolatopsis sp. FU40]|uniref:hypothetical protein n=1 Tax=Amycolatopsis sp. FU40 TaxID=2914159 RepID=UPI001F21ED09|nr:hypothetical protein [Amycolatopsis sp. FU40]UKD50914.1 hypothetical protein L3Q65_01055 [Amycolatopsis sp. FU40]